MILQLMRILQGKHLKDKRQKIYIFIFSALYGKIVKDKKLISFVVYNFTNVFELMPKLKERLILVYENQKTRRDKQFDHILTTKDIKCNYYDIVNARFDHMLCVVELEIDDF